MSSLYEQNCIRSILYAFIVCKESEYIIRLIEEKNRINLIFSNRGFGKTALLENLLDENNSDIYVRVNTNELLSNSAPEFYFISKVISAVNENLCFDRSVRDKSNTIWNKYKSNLSVSFNIGPIGIGYNLPQDYKISIDELIENIKLVNENIYIHIENVQKIDFTSLRYLIRIINETDNIFFFLECSDDEDLCCKIKTILSDNMINVNIISINKLDWTHVSLILKDLNILVTNSVKEEYEALNGNIKKLIFNHKNQISTSILLDTEQQLLLDFIELVGTELSVIDIHKILINYDVSNKYMFSLPNIRKCLKDLSNLELIGETNSDYYYITDIGIKYTAHNKTDLLISVLSNYYMPIIINSNSSQTDTIKGLRLLMNIYLSYDDIRITKIIQYIEPNLLLLNGDKNTIDRIYCYLKKIFTPDLYRPMLLLAKSYIKIDCFDEAKEIFDKYIPISSNLAIILYATILIHVESDNINTETYIKKQIEEASNLTLLSALYTCLLSLYMQTKSTSYVLSYVSNLDRNKLTETDYYIIQKNISIYFNTNVAIDTLNSCYKFFKYNNYNRLAIATAITLATKYAQSGQIKFARNALGELCDDRYLGIQDLVYIENNLAILDMLETKINRKVINRLKESYSFCKDEYTHLLIANNILIYYVQSNELEEASLYVKEIEKKGFDIYNFDDYLHIAYLNLKYYYTKIGDKKKINYYNQRLEELQNKCHSIELKTYISAGLNGTNILKNKDRWFYMASYPYRPAFVGHWIINDFDC